MIKFIGIINIIFFFLAIYILITKSKGFTLKKHTISHLASFPKTGFLFNIVLFIFSINQVIFSIVIYNSLLGHVNNLALPLFIIGGILLCISSIFTLNKYPRTHTYSVVSCVLVVVLGVILLTIGFLKIQLLLGILLIIFTCTIPILFILRHHILPGGELEIPIFVIIGIWNLVFSAYLFGFFN